MAARRSVGRVQTGELLYSGPLFISTLLGMPGTSTTCRGAPTWAKSSRSADMMNSVQKRSFKLNIYQNEVKNNENCKFLMINVIKELEWCSCFKKEIP